MVVGSYDPKNIKAEMYAFGTGAWTEVEDYLFVEPGAKVICSYEMVYTPEASSFFVASSQV